MAVATPPSKGGLRAALTIGAIVIFGVPVALALFITIIIGAQPTCESQAAEQNLTSWDGPGSLGGILGTGVTAEELRRSRQHPLGGTKLTPGMYRSTAYAPAAGGVNCDVAGKCTHTASGIRVDRGQIKKYLIASNPRLNQYGAIAYIWPNPFGWRGPFVVADTGGDFQGTGRLDFYVFEPHSNSKALTWGNARMVRVSSQPIVAGGPTPNTPKSDAQTRNVSLRADTTTSSSSDTNGPQRMAKPTTGTFTSPFGPRWGRLHAGVDIAAPTGTPIVAVLDGVVVLKGWVGGYGNFTCIRHRPNLSSCYAHQSRFAGDVRQGAPVKRGQTIGYVGNTGNSTGPHLHFEMRLGPGFSGQPVDPMPYLQGAETVTAPAAPAASGECVTTAADTGRRPSLTALAAAVSGVLT